MIWYHGYFPSWVPLRADPKRIWYEECMWEVIPGRPARGGEGEPERGQQRGNWEGGKVGIWGSVPLVEGTSQSGPLGGRVSLLLKDEGGSCGQRKSSGRGGRCLS